MRRTPHVPQPAPRRRPAASFVRPAAAAATGATLPASALVASALVVAAVVACGTTSARQSAADDVRAKPAEAPLRVFATGDTRGYLEMCGCEDGQVGGIARRGTYLRETRRPGDVWIDLGNFTAGIGDIRRLRREGLLDAFAGLRYDAVVPGAAEITDGPVFEDAARARGVRIVTANVLGPDSRPVFDPWVLVDLPDGRRAAIVGLTESVAKPPAERTVAPAEPALRRAVAELAGQAHVIVAATSLPVAQAQALADTVPGVALVLSGCTPEPDVTFTAGPGAVVGVAGHLGEYVTRVDFSASLAPSLTWRAWLDERLADDREMAAIVQHYRQGTRAIDLAYVQKVATGHRDAGFAGSLSCAPCHRDDYDAWKVSRHATAMRTLVAKEVSRDPDCVPCHLVDVPDRWETWDPDAMGVGCEACHGPSKAHTEDPEAVRTPARDGGRSACASKCHHPPEVKNFDFTVQWPRIRHGGK